MRNDRAATVGLRLVVMLGVVSLLSDMTYEGARSVSGPFLASLGAGAVVVAAFAGLGELVGYGLRLVSGQAGTMDFSLTGREAAQMEMICGGQVRVYLEPLMAGDGEARLVSHERQDRLSGHDESRRI